MRYRSTLPSRDWLAYVITSKARSKILNFLNSKEKTRNLALGRELLEHEVQKYDSNPASILKGPSLESAIQACGFNSFENLLTAIGFGKISVHRVAEKLVPKEKLEAKKSSATMDTRTGWVVFLSVSHSTATIRSGSLEKALALAQSTVWTEIPRPRVI